MTRGAVLGLICGACAATSCGGGTSDGCTAGCENIIACDPRGTLDGCLAQCTPERGNQAMLECLAGVFGCDTASVTPCVDLTVCPVELRSSPLSSCSWARTSAMPPSIALTLDSRPGPHIGGRYRLLPCSAGARTDSPAHDPGR